MPVAVAKYLSFLLFSVIIFQSHAQSQYHGEKVYIHFDKPYYASGENCWYKAYVVNTENFKATESSGILYVDWINPAGKIIKHQKLKIYSGEAYGDFAFIPSMPAGYYSVRAYTNLMRNEEPEFFFTESLFVFGDTIKTIDATVNTVKNTDLQFFPEGGVAVSGLQTQVAFKAIDHLGKGTDVTGHIVDEKNNFVNIFRSSHKGMGIFPYLPAADKTFSVILENGSKYALPRAAASGLVMNVNNMHPQKVFVQLQSTETVQIKLAGFSREKVVFEKLLEAGRQSSTIEILKEGIPGGIFQLTAYDRSGNPLAERILFIDKKEKFNISIASGVNEFNPRDSVAFRIKTTDANGHPIQTSLSVSITDGNLVHADSVNESNISTYFLLESDIRGIVENPGWFLKPENKYALDLVMLTNGWRKYDWVYNGKSRELKFPAEQSLTLSGKVLSKNGSPVPFVSLSLMIADIDFNGVYNADTDWSGSFRIENVDFSDSSSLIWQVRNEKAQLMNAKIVLSDSIDIPPVLNRVLSQPLNLNHSKRIRPPDNRIQNYDSASIKMLQAVEVVGRRRKQRDVGYNRQVIKPSKEDYEMLTSTFLSRYALALSHLEPVQNNLGETFWITPGGGCVRIVINGYPADDKGPSGHPFFILNSYPTENIDYAYIFGDNRNGYTIILQTKKEVNKPTPGIFKQQMPGYYLTRNFYHPKYGSESNLLPDHRTTLYWDPYVVTDANGEAVISFYNSDIARKFLIVTEGMSNGLTGCASKVIGNGSR